MRRFALLLGFALSLLTAPVVAQTCDGFTDVLASSPFCPDVTWIADYGVTKGCAPSEFCPNENVSRLQMAAFMHRLGENAAFVNGLNAFGGPAILGTADNNSLFVFVNNGRAITIEPVVDSVDGFNPNVIAGQVGNSAAAGVAGATIAGGGGCNPSTGGTCGSFEANQVTGNFGTVGGGGGNSAAIFATVAGGLGNTASGFWSAVPGGLGNTASGELSFAAGYNAVANQEGSFAWGGWSAGGGTSFSPNRFHIFGEHGLDVEYCSQRADGGGTCWVVIGDQFAGQAIATSTGAFLSSTGVWTNSSDRALKTDFTAVDAQAVLAKVAQMPIDEWRYKSDTRERHLGPVAQDFYAAFSLGTDDKHIGTVDEGGVALAAIKGLYELYQRSQTELRARDQQLAALREELDAIKAALNLR